MTTKNHEPYSYSLNWMGPINKKWCEEHGNHWCIGRIDIRGVPDEPWGLEYGVPCMHEGDWANFGTFLRGLNNVDVLYTKQELFEMFETLHGKIRWKDDY